MTMKSTCPAHVSTHSTSTQVSTDIVLDIEYQHCASENNVASNITRFQDFSRLELPRLVRRTLETIVEQEAQPLEDRLKERLVDIVKECQTQLETMFQTATGVTNDTSVPPTFSTESFDQQVRQQTNRAMFEDFESLPIQTRTNSAPVPFASPLIGSSSVVADTGHESTGAPTNWLIPESEFPLPAINHYDTSELLDLGGYSEFFSETPSTANPTAYTSTSWPFVNQFPDVYLTASTHDASQLDRELWPGSGF
jgi:hypothetical protein